MTYTQRGFTLIEVLLALAILSIALTAILSTTSQVIVNTQRIQEKTISHWVAVQGVKMVQLGLLTTSPGQEITEVTNMLGQRWFWRLAITPTNIKSVDQITIRVSKRQAGPFTNSLTAFRYHHE